MLTRQQDHWMLVLSGQQMGRFDTIKSAIRMIRTLHHNCKIESTCITEQIYELKTSDGYLYTVLWSLGE